METGYLQDGTYVRIYDDIIYIGQHETVEYGDVQDFNRTKEIIREEIQKERQTQINNYNKPT